MPTKLEEAKKQYQSFQLEEAKSNFEQVLEQDAGNQEARLYLARIHSKQQAYGRALNYYQEVLKADPQNQQALTGIKLTQNILQLSNNYYYENPYTDDELYQFD